jgi:hypothetical protein
MGAVEGVCGRKGGGTKRRKGKGKGGKARRRREEQEGVGWDVKELKWPSKPVCSEGRSSSFLFFVPFLVSFSNRQEVFLFVPSSLAVLNGAFFASDCSFFFSISKCI